MATFDQIKYLFTDGLEQVIIVASILVMTALFAHIASFLLKRKFKKSSEQLHTDPKSYSFVRHTMIAIIYLVGIGFSIYTVPSQEVFYVPDKVTGWIRFVIRSSQGLEPL